MNVKEVIIILNDVKTYEYFKIEYQSKISPREIYEYCFQHVSQVIDFLKIKESDLKSVSIWLNRSSNDEILFAMVN